MTEKDAWDSVRKAVDFMPADFYAPIPSPQEAIDAIHAAGGPDRAHELFAVIRDELVSRTRQLIDEGERLNAAPALQ